jgi:hypothetical protein
MTLIDRPAPELYEAAKRLRLGHPSLLTAEQHDIASRCTGCIVHADDPTRHVVAVAGCPAHSGEER